MLTLHVKKNPFTKAEVSKVEFAGKTLREIVAPHGEFKYPTIVRVNGSPWLRADWDSYVEDESTIEVVSVVGAALPTVLLVANIVSLVASAAFTVYGIYKARKAMRAFSSGIGQYDADPFFSVDGHSNKANVGNPVEVAYGRNRIWPSYVARPYHAYVDDRLSGMKNTAFIQIFCIGQGDFDIHTVKIGESPIESYRGVSYEVVRPGQGVSPLARIASIPMDFEEFELTVGQSSEMFVATPIGMGSDLFEVDVEFNWLGDSSGTHLEDTYEISASIYEVDSNNSITDSSPKAVVTLRRPDNPAGYDNRPSPHRNTFQFTSGGLSNTKRYAIQFKYETNYVDVSGDGVLKFLQLRSFSDPGVLQNYPDKTILVVKYNVNNIDDTIANDRVNVVATRKLLTIRGTGGSRVEITQPTRSIPWAIFDVLTNTVYGGGLSEDYVDLNTFSELHSDLEKEGLFFDYVFNQKTTVEDAVRTIAAAGRCSLAFNGSKLALVRETCNSIPEAMFTTENTYPGTFAWSSELFDPTETDGVEVSYVDTDSGQQNTVVFTPEGSSLNSVQKINPQGIGSREQAWRDAAYRMRKLLLIRDTFKFKTGLEGYVPSIGSVALLSCDLTGFGESGFVEDFFGGYLKLSKEVTLLSVGAIRGRIMLRADDGSAMGPFDIASFVAGSSATMSREVYIGAVQFPIDFWRTDREPCHFIAWSGDSDTPVATKVRIESVDPSDDGSVEITATNYDPRVYEFDHVAVPDAADEETPVDAGTGAVGVPWVRLKQLDVPSTDFVRIWWGRNYGATSYKVYKNDVLVWSGTDTYVDLSIQEATDIKIGVSAMNGATESTTSDVFFDKGGIAIANPYIDVSWIVEESDGIRFWWNDVAVADGYEVRALVDAVYSDWYPVQGTGFKYTKTMFREDYGTPVVSAASLTISFDIRAVSNGVSGPSSSIATSIDRPSAPSSVTINQDAQTILDSVYYRMRNIAWEGDKWNTFKVYALVYAPGTQSPGLEMAPWEIFAETDKKAIITTKNFRYQPLAATLFNSLTKISEASDDFYGSGWKCSYPGLAWSYPANTLLQDAFWIGEDGSEEGGKFYSGIWKSGYGANEIWIMDLTASGTLNIAYLPPHVKMSGPLGSTYRVKGAIVADNGWFDSSAVAVTTFDIDA